ncbi:MAG: DUF6518 family protein [Thermoleophilia bacterium]
MTASARSVLPACALGLALGGGGQLAPDLDHRLYWVVALGVPWLLAAFAAGALVGDARGGAAAGATALVVGTLAYYALRVAFGGGGLLGQGGDALRGAPVVVGWCAAAAAGGAAFGMAGAVWRRGGTVANLLGTALVSGALVGEALLLAQEWTQRGPRLVLAAELAAGAALPFVLTRRRALIVPALALTALVAVGVAVTEDGVRDALRVAGWSGA